MDESNVGEGSVSKSSVHKRNIVIALVLSIIVGSVYALFHFYVTKGVGLLAIYSVGIAATLIVSKYIYKDLNHSQKRLFTSFAISGSFIIHLISMNLFDEHVVSFTLSGLILRITFIITAVFALSFLLWTVTNKLQASFK